ncbi:hypothetical protein CBR_g685 [Chara braunii]|uniref:UBA domain-containing protein n=1 Tax=Chara braunii TaxID=69332 RepID=A0A388KC27_CHABU|nr:hypothetical protein CBR_g685 [Chara braunii]|eukprot:GBG67556.1 hypothetical protein CBR_g685 [Chara braunii]
MATAFSLLCGDCGVQLRSMKEAQDHAEAFGHSNFKESTEAVLSLVCATCGKPCRSKTEADLHTKRTQHADFVDKTKESSTAVQLVVEKEKKPVESLRPVLESAEPQAGQTDVEMATEGEAGGVEMVVPMVNRTVLAELEEMGFPKARATRALHFCGREDVEAAVNWIVEHEEDPDIDEMPLVPADATAAKPKPLLTPEEAKAKAAELVERARKKKEEEEKRMEREREQERLRIGREMMEAKRIEEDQERKRLIELRAREKEEERQAREKIRRKLEEDKAERRMRLGLPPKENTPEPQPTPAASAPEVKKPFVPVKPASKAEQMRDCLRKMKQSHKDEGPRVKKAFETLMTYIGNIARSPGEEKFRKIRLGNPSFQERVGSLEGGIDFLQLCGFEKQPDGEFLVMSKEHVDLMLLRTAGGELNSAIVNPFFGVL